MEVVRPVADRGAELAAPVHCGEFGVYLAAPRDCRYSWLADVIATFQELGIGWCYWTYRDMGFGVAYPEARYADLPEYRSGVDDQLLDVLTQ